MGGHFLCYVRETRVSRDTGCLWQAGGMTRYLPLFLLAACASPGPGEYHRGTPPAVRPMAPPSRAPRYAPPGAAPAQAQPLPPSPHKRALPPTREPGLWSGDQPRAALADKDPELDGFPLVLPEDASPAERKQAHRCAAAIPDAMFRGKAVDDYDLLLREQQACLVATLYANCLKNAESHLDADLSAERLREMHRLAKQAEDVACRDVPRTATMREAAIKTLKALMRAK
jgi:hypothetical protein